MRFVGALLSWEAAGTCSERAAGRGGLRCRGLRHRVLEGGSRSRGAVVGLALVVLSASVLPSSTGNAEKCGWKGKRVGIDDKEIHPALECSQTPLWSSAAASAPLEEVTCGLGGAVPAARENLVAGLSNPRVFSAGHRRGGPCAPPETSPKPRRKKIW